jgi:hypothetical protein
MPTNVALRFRDLNIEIGDTIKEHRKIIDDFRYCWWGWWKKAEERVPYSVMRYFKNVIASEGYIWIFLVDSGTRRLYNAKLIDLDYANDEIPKECREIDKVPEYYFSKKCLVWFCFCEINDTEPDEIKNWVYYNVSDFIFETEPEKFGGKQVTSIEEMITSRHRTMYFLKPFKAKSKKNYCLDLGNYVHHIMKFIEEINKYCDYSPRASSPIQIPRYPKEMEEILKYPSTDEKSFSIFARQIYMLFIDGHKQLMQNDGSVIGKYEFLQIASSIYDDIRLFRNVLHHADISETKRIKLGKLFKKVCGKTVLDDPGSIIFFQLDILRRTAECLEKEFELVKKKLVQLAA